jgi:hypothetical protein
MWPKLRRASNRCTRALRACCSGSRIRRGLPPRSTSVNTVRPKLPMARRARFGAPSISVRFRQSRRSLPGPPIGASAPWRIASRSLCTMNQLDLYEMPSERCTWCADNDFARTSGVSPRPARSRRTYGGTGATYKEIWIAKLLLENIQPSAVCWNGASRSQTLSRGNEHGSGERSRLGTRSRTSSVIKLRDRFAVR